MSFNYRYKCNDCGFHFNAKGTPKDFIKCQRCKSKNIKYIANEKDRVLKFRWTDRKYHGLKLRWWIWLIFSTVSSIVVGSVLTYFYITILDRGFWWIIPVGFIGGFILPVIVYFFTEY